MKNWKLYFFMSLLAGSLLCSVPNVQAQAWDYRGVPDQIFASGFQINVPDHCAGILAPIGTTLDTSRSTLPQLFGPFAQWGSASVAQHQFFFPGEYVTLQFVPPVAYGKVTWSPGSGNTGHFRVRISKCPGDFRDRVDAPANVTYCTPIENPAPFSSVQSTFPGVGWGCPLIPGETYFLNVLMESCPVSVCEFYGNLNTL